MLGHSKKKKECESSRRKNMDKWAQETRNKGSAFSKKLKLL